MLTLLVKCAWTDEKSKLALVRVVARGAADSRSGDASVGSARGFGY